MFPANNVPAVPLRRKWMAKIGAIIIFLSLAGLGIIYRSLYPLTLTDTRGFLVQIPTEFWVLLVGGLVGATVLSTYSRTTVAPFLSIVAVSFLLNYHQFLLYGVAGGDVAGELVRLRIMSQTSHLTIELFNYFQWPTFFILQKGMGQLLGTPDPSNMLWIGYLAYYGLFSCVVALFTYSYTSGRGLAWFVAGISYVIFTRFWLNNQYVPQFLALVLVMVLFSAHKIRGTRGRLLQVALFLTLVLTHPMFFVFYVCFVAVRPFVAAVIEMVDEKGSDRRPFTYQFLQTLRHALSSALILLKKLRHEMSTHWKRTVVVLVSLYSFFAVYRFIRFHQDILYILAGPANQGSSNLAIRILRRYFFGTQQIIIQESQIDLLYEISSSSLYEFTVQATGTILLTLVALAFVALLLKPVDRFSPRRISVALAGSIYYGIGFLLPIEGVRAFQVLLLPLGAFLENLGKYRKVFQILVVIALIGSPVIVANFLVNASIAGGGNVQNYYAAQANQFWSEQPITEESILHYPVHPFPIAGSTSENDLQTYSLKDVISGDSGKITMMLYGKRQRYYTEVQMMDCNFEVDRRNVIYDNNVKMVKDSIALDGFHCTEVRTSRTE